MQKNLFELNLLSQGIIEQDYLSKNVKKIGSDKNINFSNESVKKTTTYDLLFIIQLIFFKMSIHNTLSKHRQIKLQRLEEVRIWAFGLLVH